MIDIVILSKAVTDFHKALTQQTIDTIINTKQTPVNIIVIEGIEGISYDNATTLTDTSTFNYNAFMNKGAAMGNGEIICFANNDLEFKQGWDVAIIEGMEKNHLDSASAYCEFTHKQQRWSATGIVRIGWQVRGEFTGWCFFLKRNVWEAIGGLDEDFSFWCADDATVEQLQKGGYKHGLITGAKINHISGGQHTLKTLPKAEQEVNTFCQVVKFNRKYDRNVWGMGKGNE
jgi:hypothetical protein